MGVHRILVSATNDGDNIVQISKDLQVLPRPRNDYACHRDVSAQSRQRQKHHRSHHVPNSFTLPGTIRTFLDESDPLPLHIWNPDSRLIFHLDL